MKKLVPFLAILLILGQAPAQTTEYLQQKDFKLEKQKLNEGINAAKRQLMEIKKEDLKLKKSIDSIQMLVGYHAGQQGMTNDSLVKTSARLNALQEKVDSEKFLPKGLRILFIVLLVVVLATLFVMILAFRKKAGENQRMLVELDRKMNDRLDNELKNFSAELQNYKSLFIATSNELENRITSALADIEGRNQSIEKHINESLVRVESRIDPLGPDIAQLRDEQFTLIKAMDEKLLSVKQEEDNLARALAARLAKLEEGLQAAKGK